MIVLVRLVTDPIVYVAIIGLFAAPITGLVTWWLNRGRDRIDRTVSLITASGEAVDAIRDVMVALQHDLDRARSDLDEVQAQYKELKESNESLLEINRELIESINSLRSELRAGLADQELSPQDFWHTVNKLVGDY